MAAKQEQLDGAPKPLPVSDGLPTATSPIPLGDGRSELRPESRREPSPPNSNSLGAISKHEKKIHISPLIAMEAIMRVSKSVCKVSVHGESDYGSGFLGKFYTIENGWLWGLFTNNHVLNEESLAHGKIIDLTFAHIEDAKCYKMQVEEIHLTKEYKRVTCSVLDFTFIDLSHVCDSKGKSFVKSGEYTFLALEWTKDPTYGDDLLIIQHPDGPKQMLAMGILDKLDGFDLCHKISTDEGSSGSPVVKVTKPDGLTVVGIHKQSPGPSETYMYNIAVSSAEVVKAIRQAHDNLKPDSNDPNLISNYAALPPSFKEQEQNEMPIEEKKMPNSQLTLYSVLRKGKRYWFVLTFHGQWYCTSDDPFKLVKNRALNWQFDKNGPEKSHVE